MFIRSERAAAELKVWRVFPFQKTLNNHRSLRKLLQIYLLACAAANPGL